MRFIHKFDTVKTHWFLRLFPEKLPLWVQEDAAYWDALKKDDIEAWEALPKKTHLWVVTDEGSLIRDTKWTAAGKLGAKKCLFGWQKDHWLEAGQVVWGTADEGFGRARHGGGNLLHSISTLTFDPEVSFWVKGLVDDKWLNPSQQTWDGLTPLHACAAYGHASGIELLMQKGADVLAKTKTGATPLEYAARLGTAGTVLKILHWGGGNLSEEDRQKALEAAIKARAGKRMEIVFIKQRLFSSVQEWKEVKERVLKKEVKYKEVQWASQIWQESKG